MKRLNELAATEAVELLARRQISAEELTRACLDRIAAREPEVQAWQFIDAELALTQARAIDANPRAPLRGLPIGIKDIVDTAEMPTEYGSSIYRGNRPRQDAAAVAALRRSGAVILGKTVTTELAYFTPGKTHNPHHPGHTPGGSSSGSAAAVADFMVPIALGTQTAGSIIRPASFCGVIGYKPTFGRFPMAGIKPFAPSLDTLGFFARSISDVSLLSEAITGGALSASPVRSAPRIGLCRTEQWPHASADSQRVLLESRNRLRDAGAPVDDVDLGDPFQGLHRSQAMVMAVEACTSFKSERENHAKQVGPKLHDLFAEGDRCTSETYAAAIAQAEECRRRMISVFTKYDALITPSAIGEAPAGLESTGDPAFNRIWTLLHLPCINLPVGSGQHGLPVGIQLVGEAGGDAKLVAIAAWMLSQLAAIS